MLSLLSSLQQRFETDGCDQQAWHSTLGEDRSNTSLRNLNRILEYVVTNHSSILLLTNSLTTFVDSSGSGAFEVVALML